MTVDEYAGGAGKRITEKLQRREDVRSNRNNAFPILTSFTSEPGPEALQLEAVKWIASARSHQ